MAKKSAARRGGTNNGTMDGGRWDGTNDKLMAAMTVGQAEARGGLAGLQALGVSIAQARTMLPGGIGEAHAKALSGGTAKHLEEDDHANGGRHQRGLRRSAKHEALVHKKKG